jgi:hypothetical protein
MKKRRRSLPEGGFFADFCLTIPVLFEEGAYAEKNPERVAFHGLHSSGCGGYVHCRR